MRWIYSAVLLACGALHAADSGTAFPLWDGKESTADYARRANLPAEQSLDLGNGVKLDFVLVPAGKFVMGTAPAPAPAIPYSGMYVAVGLGAALGLAWLLALVLRKRMEWRFPLNIAGLMLILAIGALAGGSYLLRKQWREYARVKEHFTKAPDWERPAHDVTLAAPFYMGKYELTQQQYEALMGSNPSRAVRANLPVESVSWIDAKAFCDKLQAKTGKRVQLPTEAQWEYACRAGTATLFNTGNAIGFDQANINGDKISSIGSFKPNAFGLHDMHGNVWEWCADFYADHYYDESPARDPQGPAKSAYGGNARVLRGGSCRGDPDFYRSASRRWLSADDSDDDIGFRLMLKAD